MKGKIVWEIFRREILASVRNKGQISLLIAASLMMFIMMTEGATRWKDRQTIILLTIPLLWICVLAVVCASSTFSAETEAGTMELLKMSPASPVDIIAGKLLFCLMQYLLFSILYLSSLAFYASATADFIFLLGTLLVAGPYLVLYLILVLFEMLISSVSKKVVVPVALSIGLSLVVLLFNPNVALIDLGFKKYNLMYPIMVDLFRIETGSYPDPTLWGALVLFAIGLLCLLFLSLKRLWGVPKQ
jgi:ABC-type transport system involved in cytochrome c biogenesis permease component